jgi:hypothetical protein
VDDRGAEIVQHDPAGHATEELERRPMQAQPGGEALVEGQLGVLVPAARQGHDERPGAPQPIGLGIPIQTAEAEVDLCFLPRVDFEAQRRARGRRRHAAQEALHRRVAALEPVLLDEELPDRLALYVLGMPGQDLLAERLDQGLLLSWPLPGRRSEQLSQRGRLGQRPRQQPVRGGPLPIVRHGVTADLEVARDAARPLAQLQPSQDLANLGHRTPPSRHAPPPSETNVTSRRQSAPVGASPPRSPVTSRWVAHDARPWVAQHGRPCLAQDGRPRVAQLARPRRDVPASRRRTLLLLPRSDGPMRQTIALPPPLVSPLVGGSSQVVATSAGRWPFPTLSRESVLGCLGPYRGGPLGALARYFPSDIGLPPRVRGRRPAKPRSATSERLRVSRLQPFADVQASTFARHPGRSYRGDTSITGQPWRLSSEQNTRCYLRVHRMCLPSERAIDGRGLTPHKTLGLVGCSHSVPQT